MNLGKGNNKKFFAHEKLGVYSKSMDFMEWLIPLIHSFSKKYAVNDQLNRAAESLLMNLMQFAEIKNQRQKLNSLEYSLGSSLECAACLDICEIRKLISSQQTQEGKNILLNIVKMEVALRKNCLSQLEEKTESFGEISNEIFFHENLKVYQCSLQLCQMIQEYFIENEDNENQYTKKIDNAVTSLILNIAEGNGRFSSLDHNRFIDIAINSGIKLVAYLDLVEVTEKQKVDKGKGLLMEILPMLHGMKGYLQGD